MFPLALPIKIIAQGDDSAHHSSMTLKHRICVEVSFGSEIQRDVSLRVLNMHLDAFKSIVESNRPTGRMK